MDYAAIIKERVSTPELFAYYGFERNHAGVVCCMFHQDKHASMKVYDGEGGYHCFSCHAHGDIINFVQRHFGLPFRGAISKINDDFRLGLPISGTVDAKQNLQILIESEALRKRREAFKIERDGLYKAYCDALSEWSRLDIQLMEYAPTGPSEPLDDRYVEAAKNIDYAAYVLNLASIALYEFEQKMKRRR